MSNSDARAWASRMRTEGLAELRELVMRTWDPIGVSDVPEARDEYDGYLWLIAAALRRGDSAEAVAGYLSHVRRDEFGLEPDPVTDLHAAEEFIAWHAAAPG